MKKNPYARMFRADKLSIALIEEALRLYEDSYRAKREIPTLQMLNATKEELYERAKDICRALEDKLKEDGAYVSLNTDENERISGLELKINGVAAHIGIVPCPDAPGGGSLPGVEIDGWALGTEIDGLSAMETEDFLKGLKVPIIPRIRDGKVLLSVRTILPGEEEYIEEALKLVAQRRQMRV